MAVDIEKVRKSLEVCPIKWVGDGKFTNEILDERHVRVVVPVEGLHLNHVGIVYAGTMFTAMELAAGAIFMCTYGLDEFVPIVSNFEISFLKPTKKDLVAEIEWTEEEAAERIMMVYNGDIKTAVNKVIGAEHFDKEYVDYVNALKYSWGGTTVKLAVDGHLTDLKMLSQFGTLDQEKFYEDLAKGIIPEEVNFFMSNPSNYSKSAAPEGKQMICFTCPHQLDLPEEIEARLVDKMMVTAEKYIPGLSEHIIIKEVLFNSDIMTASGKGGAGIGIGQVAGQTGAYRPKIKLPVEGAYVVGAAAGGAGVGTELAVNSAIEFFDNYCK